MITYDSVILHLEIQPRELYGPKHFSIPSLAQLLGHALSNIVRPAELKFLKLSSGLFCMKVKLNNGEERQYGKERDKG